MAPDSRPSDQELVQTYNLNRQNLQAIASKAAEIQRDVDEHKLVIETLEEVYEKEPERKCFRMIDSVLVERTVKDVLPALKTTHEKLNEAMQNLAKTYQQKDQEQQAFIKKYNIEVRS